MRIIKPAIVEQLERNQPLRLDLGCGPTARSGYFGVDFVNGLGSDIVADLNEPLHLLPDNCCEAIYTRHALEKIINRSLGAQDFFERRLSHLFHASQINYALTPVKG